jgi:hypothetical protein
VEFDAFGVKTMAEGEADHKQTVKSFAAAKTRKQES